MTAQRQSSSIPTGANIGQSAPYNVRLALELIVLRPARGLSQHYHSRDSYFLRLRRSQMSAAIDPTTPIAANPLSASISGTTVLPA